MTKINIEDWTPADGLSLEENALRVVKESTNHLVVAGPGAGKTELLAQKACFLLQTNSCRFPHKILAISFKTDAAFNLKERVKLRCGEELARRFDSFTFDSFAKQLLDRFRHALPVEYQISGEYDIILPDRPILDHYKSIAPEYSYKTDDQVIMNFHTVDQLPLTNATARDKIRVNVWNNLLKGKSPSLSFKMLMRMAECVVNSNPKIKKFLQETYYFVFLDEFQDSTEIQYEFLKSCFLPGSNVFTAVGDDKQRIMGWAGAKETIFSDFMSDTKAENAHLVMNFRSAPKLVTLQNHLSKNLLGEKVAAIPSPKWHPGRGDCFFWSFDNTDDEMRILFEAVSAWIQADHIKPSEVCILVKQQLDRYAGKLIEYFNSRGLRARNEDKFQDLLSQEVVIYLIHSIYLVFEKNVQEAKPIAFNFLAAIHTEFAETQLLRLSNSFSFFIRKLKETFRKETLTKDELDELIDQIIAYANKDRIRAVYPVYKSSKLLDIHIDDLKNKLLAAYNSSRDMPEALEKLLGRDTVSVMTIHKSKGLEYHTVVFIGLEDDAFWTFENQPDEDKRAFFVALSRAKERVVFTFSALRENYKKVVVGQNLRKIESLFNELKNSGIVKIEKK